MNNTRNYENVQNQQPKTSKNGYEIRTDILSLARTQLEFEYFQKMKTWEDGDESGVRPSIPSLTDIIAASNILYEFVNKR